MNTNPARMDYANGNPEEVQRLRELLPFQEGDTCHYVFDADGKNPIPMDVTINYIQFCTMDRVYVPSSTPDSAVYSERGEWIYTGEVKWAVNVTTVLPKPGNKRNSSFFVDVPLLISLNKPADLTVSYTTLAGSTTTTVPDLDAATDVFFNTADIIDFNIDGSPVTSEVFDHVMSDGVATMITLSLNGTIIAQEIGVSSV